MRALVSKYKRQIKVIAVIATCASAVAGTLISRAGNSECDRDKARLKFYDGCVGELVRQLVNPMRPGALEKAKTECQCILDNFTVQKMAKPPTCDFDFVKIQVMVDLDKVKLKCRLNE